LVDNACKWRVDVFGTYIHVPANKMQAGVSYQRSWKQAAFAEDLKTVANSKHKLALGGESLYSVHYRREMGQRTGPKVIAV
jgi:hypothetical protein